MLFRLSHKGQKKSCNRAACACSVIVPVDGVSLNTHLKKDSKKIYIQYIIVYKLCRDEQSLKSQPEATSLWLHSFSQQNLLIVLSPRVGSSLQPCWKHLKVQSRARVSLLQQWIYLWSYVSMQLSPFLTAAVSLKGKMSGLVSKADTVREAPAALAVNAPVILRLEITWQAAVW